ncbi:MFS 1 and/or Sugar tr domain containing protein [Asbolus verrucosus]|uniref:MFS 1 and/or Sugar tr domain containing protein n=1 Tax=Asbolus verrucosus TaxID=1661398 RepID=A0A482WDT9_ASBVE|nr:MFS 1 and/or Sugar tr domain containing protein [Asbolus verrucosus]
MHQSNSTCFRNDARSRHFHPQNRRNKVEVLLQNATRYEWSQMEQGLILAAYFWGYIITVLPAGTITQKFGPWNVILWSSLLSAVLTGLTPLSIRGGVVGVVACRFILGLLGGFAYPAIYRLIFHWSPPKEKDKFLAAMMGNIFGTACTWPIIATISSLMSWPWGFYVLVIIMGVYCIAFFFIVADSPQYHFWISEEEKSYINECQKEVAAPVKFGNLWGLNVILTYGPMFVAHVLGFGLIKASVLASLPYLSRLFCSQIFGIIGERMRNKHAISLTINPCPLLFLQLIFYQGGCFFSCNLLEIDIALLALNQGLNGAVVVSHLVNPFDLSPNFAVKLFGIMNLFAGTAGCVVPIVTATLNEHYNREVAASSFIFTIGGIMFGATGVFFILFGSGEVQPWNEEGEEMETSNIMTMNILSIVKHRQKDFIPACRIITKNAANTNQTLEDVRTEPSKCYLPCYKPAIGRWVPLKKKGKFMTSMMGNTSGTVFTWFIIKMTTTMKSWVWGFYILVIFVSIYCWGFSYWFLIHPRRTGGFQKKKDTHFGSVWGLNFILNYAPKFVVETLDYKLNKSSNTASLPYLARLIVSYIVFLVIIRRRTSHEPADHFAVVILLTFSQRFNGAAVVSYLINFQNLAPNFAWSIFGTVDGIAGTTGFLIPVITGKVNEAYYSPTFKWNEKEQSYIISAYFYGYMTTCLPAGILAENIGPWHGLGYPAVNVLIARWAPPKEKGKFLGAMMGNTLGSVVAFSLVGFVTREAASWQWGFYVLVIIMAVYCVTFFFVISDSPENHRWISEDEKNYIIECQEGAVSTTKAVPPYLKIFLSIPFWALVICQFGNLWGLNLILTYAPKFMKETLGFNIKKSGFLAALPVGVISLLVLNQAFNGAVVVGHLINPQDLAPNFAGTVYGIMNFLAGTTGFIIPPITAVLTDYYKKELKASQCIFSLGGIMFGASGIVFIAFGTAELQSWNKKKGDQREEETK